jgi:uncharacterized oligopeptide transporter (OPT) family protein
MTIATVLLTCVIFFLVAPRNERGEIDTAYMLTALTIAAVVCIASSNGGTTSQDLKTGYLVGATPRAQQLGILVGALTSALVIGGTMLALNAAATHYTEKGLPTRRLAVPDDAPTQQVGNPHQDKDTNVYRVVHVRRGEYDDVRPGRYLVDDNGTVKYRTDMAIAQESKLLDTGEEAPRGFTAPQPHLFASLIQGILGGTLEWTLFIVGAVIAVALELAGVSALPFAVGMYIPLGATTPIFAGGMLRWVTDWWRGRAASDVETETSPGVLLASGYIAGGTLCGLLIAFLAFPLLAPVREALDFSPTLGVSWAEQKAVAEATPAAADAARSAAWLQSWGAKVAALVAFGILAAVLVVVGLQRQTADDEPPS